MGSENPFLVFSCCPVSTPYLRDLGFFDTTESGFKSHPCLRKSLKLFLVPSPTSFRKIDERKSLLNGDFQKIDERKSLLNGDLKKKDERKSLLNGDFQ